MIEQTIFSQSVTSKLPKGEEPRHQRQYEALSEVVEHTQMTELEKSAEAGNEQAFIEASQAISWQIRPPEDFLRAIHFAFAAGAHLSARRLAAKGAEQYPEHHELQKYARILSPPKLIQSNLPPDPTLDANRIWLKNYRHNYREKWLALKNGELLGAATTLQELMDSVGKNEGVLFAKGG